MNNKRKVGYPYECGWLAGVGMRRGGHGEPTWLLAKSSKAVLSWPGDGQDAAERWPKHPPSPVRRCHSGESDVAAFIRIPHF